ncbi:MAG TPA: VWA domain-containing protein [Vicinamibacterales bacterium]|nr:VWA domain-containing protein [Vicinamibacterales bacterium]
MTSFFFRGRRLAGFGTVAVAVAGLALLTVGAQATPQNTDRTIYVSAVGNNGMPMVDPPLTAAELTVMEDGAPREITKIAKADSPIYFALAYDTSLCDETERRGSCESENRTANANHFVGQMLRDALNGFTSVILAAAPSSKILVMDMAGAAVAKTEFTSNIKDIEPILSRLVPQKGEPVLNEALMDLSHRMAKVPAGNRKVVVIVNREPTTEGSTGAQYKIVGEDARKSGATFWALSVRYGTKQNGGRDELLKAIATNSGGLRLTISSTQPLGDYLRSVAANAVVQYAVTFKRPADAPPTKITSLKTSRTDLRPLTMQWSDK